MADVEASVEISVTGAGSLEEAAEAARNLADALKEAEESAGEIGGAFESAARSLASLRDDAGEAAQALKSIRDAGAGVGDVAPAAEAAAKGLASMRDDAAEAEAAMQSLAGTGGDIADIAPAADADATALGHLRDEAIEAEAALDSLGGSGAGLGGDAASADALASSLGHVRDEAAEATAAMSSMQVVGGKLRTFMAPELRDSPAAADAKATADEIAEANERFSALSDELRQFDQAAGGADISTSSLHNDLEGLGQSLGEVEARGGTTASALEDIQMRMDSLSDGLDDAEGKLGQFGGTVPQVVEGLHNFAGQYDDVASAIDDGASAVEGAGADLSDVADVAEAAGPGLLNLGENAGALGSAFSSLGETVSGVAGPVFSAALPVAIGGGVTALLGSLPALAAVGGGFLSFGALAFPALDKVKDGLTNVTSAQQAYQAAVGVEKRDPTTANLAAQQKALATLQTTWAQMPRGVSGAVQAVQQFGHAWSQVSQKSGIQQDFLGDIPKALGAVEKALPAVEGLAKSAAPVISGLFTDLGKNFQSSGFQSFISGMEKDVQPAAGAFHNLAGSVSDFISDLQGKGASSANSFLNGLAQFGKAMAGPSSTGIVNSVNALTTLMHDATDVATNKQVSQGFDILSGLASFVTGHSVTSAGAINSGIAAGNAGLIPGSAGPGAEMTPKEFAAAKARAAANGRQVAEAERQGLEHSLGSGGAALPLPIKVKPEIKFDKTDQANLEKSLTGGGLLGGGKLTVPGEAKVDKADTSGLKGGDTKVPATAQVDKVDTSGINKAASNVKIHGVTVDLSDAKLSGLTALSSSLQSSGSAAGKSFDTGLASGINSGAGAAASAAQHVVTEIKSALSTLGAAGSAAGAALGAGLASGIAASTGAAVAAATRMANEVTAAVKAAHATASPSKVFKGIGTDDVKGLILGLEGGKSELDTAAKDMAKGITAPFTDKEISATIAKLETGMKDALKAGTISATQETGISAWLDADNKRLMALAAQRKDIESKIAAADSLYKSVDQATVAGANVVTMFGNTPAGGGSGTGSTAPTPPTTAQMSAPTAQQTAAALNAMQSMTGSATPLKVPQSLTANDSLQGQLHQYLDQTRAFKNDIVKLKQEGLDPTSLQQLLQAGVTSGLPVAKEMLSGGQKGVQEIASLQKQIAAAAKSLGVTGANATYESGSQIGEGLAQGLKSELGSVTAAIKSLATQIVDEMQKDLKIHSPSQVAFGLGTQFAAGMAGGINSGGPMVGAAARELAIVASRGASGYGGGMTAHPMPIIAGGAGGGGNVTIHSHLEIGGQEFAQVMQTFTLQHARRNTGSGLQLRGRGT